MKPTATGRILLWRGGSLWIGLAGKPAGLHAHHAVQIALPLSSDRVQFKRSSGSWKSYSAAVVAAQQPHAFEARAQLIAQLFVEPESVEGRQLQLRYRSEGIAALPRGELEQRIAALASGYKRHVTDEALRSLARSSITAIAGASPAAVKDPSDARIARAIELVREYLGGAISLTFIAGKVHLSPERFRHLFIQETGVGFRAYILWLRLEFSLASYVAGCTLTEAAYAGGFADSAHLSRTFKRMFGITPGSVRPE